MRKLLKKVPLVVWAILLTVLSYLIVDNNLINGFSNEQIRLLSGFLTFVGLIFVAVNIQKQWKNERIKTEYLNQPDFKITGFFGREFQGSGPMLCDNPNECTEDHWFDLIQTGNLAAKDLKVGFFHYSEAENDVKDEHRWLTEKRLGKDDDFQYKLPQFRVPINLFDAANRMCFYVLLEYKSEYSNIKYKRIYKLCSSAVENPVDVRENDWKGRIYFYSSSLIFTTDTDSITVKEILLNKWIKFARWSKLKKDYGFEEWLIDI